MATPPPRPARRAFTALIMRAEAGAREASPHDDFADLNHWREIGVVRNVAHELAPVDRSLLGKSRLTRKKCGTYRCMSRERQEFRSGPDRPPGAVVSGPNLGHTRAACTRPGTHSRRRSRRASVDAACRRFSTSCIDALHGGPSSFSVESNTHNGWW